MDGVHEDIRKRRRKERGWKTASVAERELERCAWRQRLAASSSEPAEGEITASNFPYEFSEPSYIFDFPESPIDREAPCIENEDEDIFAGRGFEEA